MLLIKLKVIKCIFFKVVVRFFSWKLVSKGVLVLCTNYMRDQQLDTTHHIIFQEENPFGFVGVHV